MNKEYYTLITGASSGIGKEIAIEMASRGHNLILHSLPGEGLAVIGEQLKSEFNIETEIFEIDLASEEGPFNLFSRVQNANLKVNILINNAGLGIEGPLESHSRMDIDNIIFVNIRALTLLTTFFIPVLKETSSYILNVSSLGSYVATPYKSVYLASKSYIFYFTRALEAELKGSSVRTCIFVPGAVRTNRNVLERIRRAGWLSRKSSISPREVASKGLRAMFRGRRVVVPGKLSKLIFYISFVIPEGIILAVTRRIFRREFPV